ncbi:TPA: hypothetical protein ACH3X2_005865 [Trebouxia sp. C0005]
MDDIEGHNTVIIVEGEMDKLSLEEAGFTIVVSMPNGAPDKVKNGPLPEHSADKAFEYVWNCWEELQQPSCILLGTDNDLPGHALAEELARRLGRERCLRINWTIDTDHNSSHSMKEPGQCVMHKDANDVLVQAGPEALKWCVRNTQPLPLEGPYRVHKNIRRGTRQPATETATKGIIAVPATGADILCGTDWEYRQPTVRRHSAVMASAQPVASGTDGQYRMTVDSRYKQLAVGRKQLHFWAFTQAIYNFLRAIWHIFPWPMFGEMPPIINLGVMGCALLGFLVYTAGSGYGNARNQSRGLIFAYAVIAGCNSALLALAFVEYHLKRAEPLHHLGHGGAFISRLHAGHDKDPNIHALLWMAEAVVDIIGMGIGIEAAKHAINYFFSSGASSQKKKSS